VAVTEPEEAKADNIPDGTEVFAEWKEGPHRVIERRPGPGEEVEVEVQRNAYGPSDTERLTRAFRGGHAVAHHAADTFIGELMRQVPHDVEASPEGARSCNDVGASQLSDQNSLHPHGEGAVHSPDSAQDEDDEWVSDQSSPADTSVEKGQHAKTSRVSKRRRSDRHRSSVHHHSRLPHPTPISRSTSTNSGVTVATDPPPLAPDLPSLPAPGPSSSPTDADEEPRGRTPLSAAPSSSAARRQPRHMRIVSLRGSAAGSREVSPARSVRWADTGAGSSPATARWPQSPSAQGSRAPSPGPPTPGEPMEHDLS